MEAIAAVSSIIQIAQFGTQLSIGLYQLADSIASADKETRYIAKDIALFCQVLKDLAKALEFGQKAQLFRQNAFDTSLKIVEECRSVFNEIETILKKVTRSTNPLKADFRLPYGEKVRWMFRKGKVDFFRGVLESLKSTILVELAVLNYAVKISSHLTKDTVDVDELLALKSLVLANETAKQSLDELAEKDTENSDHTLTYATNGVTHSLSGDFEHIPDTSRQNLSNGEASGNLAHDMPFNLDQTVSEASNPTHRIYKTPYWSQTDRLEFAAQKLELVKWEYQRLEESITLGAHHGTSARKGQNTFLRLRIRDGLVKFGMRDDLVNLAMAALDESSGSTVPERTPTWQSLPASHKTRDSLISSGLAINPESSSISDTVVLRWMPDMFVDILHEHTQDLLENAGFPRQHVRDVYANELKHQANHIQNQDTAHASKREVLPDATSVTPELRGPPGLTWKQTVLNELPASLKGNDVVPDTIPDTVMDDNHQDLRWPKSGVISGEKSVYLTTSSDDTLRNHAPQQSGRQDTTALAPKFPHPSQDQPTPVLQTSAAKKDNSSKQNLHARVDDELAYSINDLEHQRWYDQLQDDVARWIAASKDTADQHGLSDYSQSVKRPREFTGPGNHADGNDSEADQDSTHHVAKRFRIDSSHPPSSYSSSSCEPHTDSENLSRAIVPQSRRGPGQASDDSDSELGRRMPPTSNAAMFLFDREAHNHEIGSRAATWGSCSDDGEFDFIAYIRRRQQGIDGRRRYFRINGTDEHLKIVQHLISQWTSVDEPASTGGRHQKQQALLAASAEQPD